MPQNQRSITGEGNGRMRMLNADEEACLLAHCSPQLAPLLLTALHTWFRVLELLSLTWEDVSFRHQVITVRAAYAKNGESRSVPMNEILTTILQKVRMSISIDGPVFRSC